MEKHEVGHKDMHKFGSASNTLLKQTECVYSGLNYKDIGIEQFKVSLYSYYSWLCIELL